MTNIEAELPAEETKEGGRSDEELHQANTEHYEQTAELAHVPEYPTRIERSDMTSGLIPLGGTEIVLQRHGRYERDQEADFVGSLTDPLAEQVAARDFFEHLLAQLPEGERRNVDVLFVASDTQYSGAGRRSYETATIAQQAALATFETHGIPATNILNYTGKFHTSKAQAGEILPSNAGPRTMPDLREPKFLEESPGFLEMMIQKYGGLNSQFWDAFEEDLHKDDREAMGAEGPDDIADRTAYATRVLSRFARLYHQQNPGRRLVIWAGTHYDTISPFVKREIFGLDKSHRLQVDYGAGVSIRIDSDGQATTEIGGRQYDVPLTGQKRRGPDRPQLP